MSGDRTTRPNQPDDDSFSDALDDMFGSSPAADENGSDQSPGAEPEHTSTHTPAQYTQPVAPLPSEPTSPQAPPQAQPQGRSFVRVLAMGCAGALALIVICFIILVIIGAVAGDPAT